MDNVKAIQVLTKYVKFFELMISRSNIKVPESSLEMIEACTFAVGAIGKQIPKPVKVEKREGYIIPLHLCPICGETIGDSWRYTRSGRYCANCGQRVSF